MMEKKGLGWVPDYPDLRDYNLECSEVQGVVSKSQQELFNDSLESLAIKLSEALSVLEEKADGDGKQALKKIREDIEKEISSEVKIVTVKALQLGVSGKIIEIPVLSPISSKVLASILKRLDINPQEQELNTLIFIYPIVEVITRIISPLGQWLNIGKAVERGVEQFEIFLKGERKEEFEERLQKLLEGIKKKEEKSLSEAEKTRYQRMALLAFNQVDEELKSKEDSQPVNEIYKKLRSIINVYKEKNQCKEFTIENLPCKKQIIELIESDNSSSSEDDPRYLQVLINRKLDAQIKEKSNSLQKQKSNISLSLPDFVDLSFWCSPIKDQGSLNSCTAHAGVALVEYFTKKHLDQNTNVSPLFLYKVTRNLTHRPGDVGSSIRETMKAMVLFGIPPEEYWPYDQDKFDEEPTPFCYSYAQNYQALKFFRLDRPGMPKDVLLTQIKTVLVAGFPCVFGFTLYRSIYDNSNPRGHIPYPHEQDKAEGGHAVVAVGYDDSKVIENADGIKSEGALLIRNSWGTEWGEGGYGWLPYDYVLKSQTADWWSLLKSEWFEKEQFGVGANDWTSNMKAEPKRNQPTGDMKAVEKRTQVTGGGQAKPSSGG